MTTTETAAATTAQQHVMVALYNETINI